MFLVFDISERGSTIPRTLYGITNLDPIGLREQSGFLMTLRSLAAPLPARRALQVNMSSALH
jgi:hypothetical protein